jgi:hypothetical protein
LEKPGRFGGFHLLLQAFPDSPLVAALHMDNNLVFIHRTRSLSINRNPRDPFYCNHRSSPPIVFSEIVSWDNGFGVFCLAGYLGCFDGLAIWIQQSIFLFHRSLPTPVSISMIGTLSPRTIFYGDEKMGTDWIIPAVIRWWILFLIVENRFKSKKRRLAISHRNFLSPINRLSIGPTVNTWLIHPLTWIAMACLQNAHRIEKPQRSGIPSPHSIAV